MGTGKYPRERRRSKHRAPRARREEVLSAASEVFAVKGYRASTMQDIAEAMDVTPGALYYYIRGKEELLEEIGAEPINHLIAMAEEVESGDQSPIEKIRAIVHGHLRLMMRERSLFLVSYRERIELPETKRRALVDLEDRYYDILRRIVVSAMESGALQAESPTVTTLALLGMVNWTLLWYRENKSLQIDEVAEMYFGLFLHGLEKMPVTGHDLAATNT